MPYVLRTRHYFTVIKCVRSSCRRSIARPDPKEDVDVRNFLTPLLAVICAIHIDINNIYLCKLRYFTSKALAWVDSSQGKTFSNNFSKLEQRQWRQILCSWSKFHLCICWWLPSCSEFLSSKRLKSKSLHIVSGLTWNEALLGAWFSYAPLRSYICEF